MKILIVNTFDRDGGAARSARRLHLGLRAAGVDSRMLSLHKTGDDPHTDVLRAPFRQRLRNHLHLLDALPLSLYPKREVTHWSNTFLPGSILREVNDFDPDIVHLHWINRGLLSVTDFVRWQRPIVWTLHDCWPFTGGCHYPAQGCGRYENACGSCPALASHRERDLSRLNWTRKKNAWKDINLHVIGPSRWLTQKATKSALFRERPCTALPNGIDTDLYTPADSAEDRAAARAFLGLPPDKPLVLMVAMNPHFDKNKGGSLALEAVRIAAEQLGPEAAEILIAGEADGPDKPRTPWPVHRMGVIREEADMVRLYQAADIQVVPSYLENLSNAIMEASSCALPCVVFRTGGNGDMVLHEKTGFLAEPFDSASLAKGLVELIQNPDLRRTRGDAAREHILGFSRLDLIARRHVEYYNAILESAP
ncbi:MAG: glycosyltransferase [Verrucomicrobia bacterium]|nr:glycosyltransferase [Verrucomicrobiota bacterium]MCH8513405.1 glycosyltransferase [Kiritimatiellia bacterium]